MKTISVLNLKGGVGKTFTTIQMAHEFALRGKKVLLIDNDKQGNLSLFYKQYRDTHECATAKLLCKTRPSLSNLIEPTDNDLIKIIPANMSLLVEVMIVNRNTDPDKHLRYSQVIPQAEKLGFDYIIIDNPPDMGLNVINAIIMSDDVIVPVCVDTWALSGLDLVINQIQEAAQISGKTSLAGALITRYKKTELHDAGIAWIKAQNVNVFDSKIRFSDKAAESISQHVAARVYSTNNATAIDYTKFVKEYLKEN